MFKVGDKVKFLEYSDNSEWERGYGLKVGEIYALAYVSEDEHGTISLKVNSNTVYVYPYQVELFVEKENTVINFHRLNESVVLNYNAKTIIIAKDDPRYDAVLLCIKESKGNPERLNDIPAIVEVERGFEGSGIEFVDGLLQADGVPIPTELNDRILKFRDEGLPFESLLAFWENLKKNPSFNARKMLFKFLEHNGHPLTQDGCFIAYRGVTEDFKDVHTKTFDNKPGSICAMERELVDDNPNNTCSAGLHVACYSYASTFGPKLVEVKVNPADVVAVPTDYNGTKMRTCRFEVIQECASMRNELLYGKPLKDMKTFELDEEEEEEEEESLCDANGCTEDASACDDHCQNCGEDRDIGANFCPSCGTRF